MMPRQRSPEPTLRRLALAACALLLLVSPLTGQEAAPPAEEPAPLIEDAARVDTGWPREHVSPENDRVLVFAPQIENWTDFEIIEMRVAVSVLPDGAEAPFFGALEVTAETTTDLEERTVVAFNYEVTKATFPGMSEDSTQIMVDILMSATPEASRTMSLDRLLSHADADAPLVGAGAEGLSMDPPEIFVSDVPARLILFNGEPIMSPIDSTNLLYALNTNWDVFLESGGDQYYLRDVGVWFTAAEYTGPWERAVALPEDLRKLPDDDNWADVKASLPGRWIGIEEVPRFFVSTRPAELITFDGAPELTPIEGTDLLWATNTELDVFFHNVQARYYYLVAGRWFSASDVYGEWSAVAELPADFAQIPEGHPRANVLSSVPGTVPAAEAALQAQIPQKAVVDRSTASVTVEYAGEPQFEPIEGTEMFHAVNTQSDVIRVRNTYFVCHQGVWFLSDSPNGPWVLAEQVPDEIYTIPPSSPVYHTSYVTVYESTPTTVTYGYTSGYTGMYVASGVVIWGTGYYYNPWYSYGPYPYPYYYPYPYTYGAATWYNPATGFYGRGVGYYGPYGGFGAGAAYNPATGTYARGARAYGPYGTTAVGEAYNPRTGTYGRTRQSRNAYSQWGSSVVTRGNDAAWGRHYSDSRGTVGEIRTSEGGRLVAGVGEQGSGFVGRNADGDIYAGRDGNIYKRGDEGGWQRYNDGNWQGVDRSQLQSQITPEQRSQATERLQNRPQTQAGRGEIGQGQLRDPSRTGRQDMYNQLERDRAARARGSDRSSNWRSSRGFSGRSGFSGRRGGGRRRR